MEQSVSIYIEFPRSGQQVRITVPQHIAQAIRRGEMDVQYIRPDTARNNGCQSFREDRRIQ